MNAFPRRLSVLVFWLACAAGYAAEPFKVTTEVVMLALPETEWQSAYAGKTPVWAKLWESQATRLFDIKSQLTGDEESEVRHGADKEFAESWEDKEGNGVVKPGRTVKRFVGTRVRLQCINRRRVALKLEHDLAPPVMRLHNYAHTAEGAERDKLSVEYPQFDKVEWKGEITISPEWRLVTQFLRPQGEEPGAPPGMRYLVLIKCDDS